MWDYSQNKIAFRIDECLKGSEFVSLRIGSTTYTNPDTVTDTDAECTANINADQRFEFRRVTSNPLRAGSSYEITVTLVEAPARSPGATWTTTLTSEQSRGDEYGYEYNDFGTISDRTVQHDGMTFTIEQLKYDESRDHRVHQVGRLGKQLRVLDSGVPEAFGLRQSDDRFDDVLQPRLRSEHRCAV